MSELAELSSVPSPAYRERVLSWAAAVLDDTEIMPGRNDPGQRWRKRSWVAPQGALHMTEVSTIDPQYSEPILGISLRRVQHTIEGLVETRYYYFRPFDGSLQVANDTMSEDQYGAMRRDPALGVAYSQALKDELLTHAIYVPSDDEYMDFLCDIKSFQEDE